MRPVPASAAGSSARTLIAGAAAALKSRRDEVNRLNVFPVPDGDTGTNMSLTMDAVIGALEALPDDASVKEVAHAVTQSSLMGARGNSGVILSQILRGVCDVAGETSDFDTSALAAALERSTTVAFQAVRKPVEGTILTVLRDMKDAAAEAASGNRSIDDALELITVAAFESVRRTPDLLPVLKENGVVDAGGFGLALLVQGFSAAAAGREMVVADIGVMAEPELRIEPADDWDDEEYLYCTEFLLFGEEARRDALAEYVATIGGSELVVGEDGALKIHVHTDDPAQVLAHATSLGEIAEVHVNNMRRQTAARSAALAAEGHRTDTPVSGEHEPDTPPKPIGFVTVAVGEGLKEILRSLGADVVVNGGQTMNPSTKELYEASLDVHAERVVILPNNRNIVMAAQQVASVSERPVGVVPTSSVPEAFSALLAYDPSMSFEHAIDAMTEAASHVRTGEVTTAVKNAVGKVGRIEEGQVIGIADHEIEVVGDDVTDVALRLTDLIVDDAETLTILGGSDFDDDALADLARLVEAAHPEVEVETHRGEQPLYPVIIAAE